eukprot:12320-Heterococcus_DN1.PRE.12
MATIAFCLFLTAFFNKAKTAATYGSMAFLAAVLPYYGVYNSMASPIARLCVSILPSVHTYVLHAYVLIYAICSTALAVGLLPIADYEESGTGITMETIAKTTDKTNISMAQDCSRESVNSENAYVVHDPRIEVVSELLQSQIGNKSCVSIRGLTKIYKSKTGTDVNAVNSINLDMYQGQITALLGHNGAGKTSLLGMLTGMIPVTSGTAYISGFNVKSHMSQIRQNLSVCPQHDIQYPTLTVYEHLALFAAFKGVHPSSVKHEVMAMIAAVGLLDKSKEMSKNLSGGMRRRLSLGMAFIGDSSIVLLDEPTSSLDPYSRRAVWDIIRQHRENRVIVLTTHFMDEADIIADRIAIMANGKLRCCGTSLFLKSLYGVGYNLSIVKHITGTAKQQEKTQPLVTAATVTADSSKIHQLVLQHTPQAKILCEAGAELSYQLPSAATLTFQALLSDIDRHSDELCISSYGISVTTLEEVFIRVARGTDMPTTSVNSKTASWKGCEDDNELSFIAPAYTTSTIAARSTAAQSSPSRPSSSSSWKTFKQHVTALLIKRALTMKRDRKMIGFTVFAPIVFILVAILVVTLAPLSTKVQLPALTFSIQDYRANVPYSKQCTNTQSACDVTDLSNSIAKVAHQTVTGVTGNGSVASMNDYLRDTTTKQAPYYGSYSWEAVEITEPKVVVKAIIHTNHTALHAAAVYANVLSNAILMEGSSTHTYTLALLVHLCMSQRANTLAGNRQILTGVYNVTEALAPLSRSIAYHNICYLVGGIIVYTALTYCLEKNPCSSAIKCNGSKLNTRMRATKCWRASTGI